MPADFNGTWTTDRSEGWPELLKAVKVATDNIPSGMKLTETITQNGDAITIVRTNNKDASIGNTELTINVGSNFTENFRGHDIVSSSEWKGDQLVTRAGLGKGGSVRELVGGEMVVTTDYLGIIAKSYYKKHQNFPVSHGMK